MKRQTLFVLVCLAVMVGLFLSMRHFLVRGAPQEKIEKIGEGDLYVYLTAEGQIFMLVGGEENGEWTDWGRLNGRLEKVKESGGVLYYSRENPDRDPTPLVEKMFEKIAEYQIPIQMVVRPHPQAEAGPR